MKNYFWLMILIGIVAFSKSGYLKLEEGKIKDVNYNLHLITKLMKPEIPHYNIDDPKISIVIPVYNEEKYLKNILKSIQHQTLKEVEILFIDDNSTDNSYDLLKEYKKEDRRIRIIKTKKDKGILYSRINGALKSRGEYVTFMDADDLYCNFGILKSAYDTAKEKNLDLVQFDYWGGHYDGEEEFKSLFLAGGIVKKKYDKVLKQPEIKNSFYNVNTDNDFISAVVFDKLYSRSLIEKMAKAIGKDFWNSHYIYKEDFLMSLAAAKEAERFMAIGLGGPWHWYENPNGISSGIFAMKGDKLQNPEVTNKKIGDFLDIWDKCFDMTEDDPKAETLRSTMIDMLIQPDDNRHILALTEHFEKILELCKRFVTWEHATPKAIKKVKEFGKETISYTIDSKLLREYKMKYYIFYEGTDEL